jgi:hypothetical protein
MSPIYVRNIIISSFLIYYLSAPFFSFVTGDSFDLKPFWYLSPFTSFLFLSCYSYFIEFGRVSFKSCFKKVSSFPVSPFILILLFFIALVQLSLFPWHESREGLTASVSALVRILWLSLAPIVIRSPTKHINKIYLVFSLLLSLADGSRTIFFIAFLVSLSIYLTSLLKTLILLLALLAVLLLVASYRSGWDLLNFAGGFVGEQTLATLTFYNISNTLFSFSDQIIQFIYLFTLPPLFPLYKFLSYVIPNIDHNLLFDVTSQYSHFQEMGGAFILSNFTPFGPFSLLLFPLYLILTVYFTNLLTSWYCPRLAAFLVVLVPKSDPLVYWNLIYLFAIFIYLFSKSCKHLMSFSFSNWLFTPR